MNQAMGLVALAEEWSEARHERVFAAVLVYNSIDVLSPTFLVAEIEQRLSGVMHRELATHRVVPPQTHVVIARQNAVEEEVDERGAERCLLSEWLEIINIEVVV